MTDGLEDLRKRQETFIQERNWEQFHTPKSIAMALSVEANELADILIYTLSMATQFNINLVDAATHKLEKNAERYDPETAATISDELSQWQRSE